MRIPSQIMRILSFNVDGVLRAKKDLGRLAADLSYHND
jgi:hypothetical protein